MQVTFPFIIYNLIIRDTLLFPTTWHCPIVISLCVNLTLFVSSLFFRLCAHLLSRRKPWSRWRRPRQCHCSDLCFKLRLQLNVNKKNKNQINVTGYSLKTSWHYNSVPLLHQTWSDVFTFIKCTLTYLPIYAFPRRLMLFRILLFALKLFSLEKRGMWGGIVSDRSAVNNGLPCCSSVLRGRLFPLRG